LGARRGKAELLPQLSLERNDGGPIDAERKPEMQTRFDIVEVPAETLHNRYRVTGHRVEACARDQAGQGGASGDEEAARATIVMHRSQSLSPLLERIPELWRQGMPLVADRN
jgi:hypothetical protein